MIDLVVQTLGTDAQSLVVLLEFLTVLPEEVTEGRKVSLSVSVIQMFRRAAILTWRTGRGVISPYSGVIDR